ncbi:hypothetical protein [Pseudonocardia sp. HH130629-09]|uniref:hypothetical protein n=1 Tax=Pseudonocardia sp. HH130629-09 TaxID=1641402 RepID=UPI0006CB8165|nr:hypothetical protein [Pseudonocardia sp. HH130629-09]ALE82468.1 hypothetical protein XF36_04350 [Pseudonocardia sp. HH130629-09]
MAEFGQSPRQTAAEQARHLVRRIAVDVFGASVVETPIPGFTVITDRALDDPLGGVRAALLLRGVAGSQLYDHARAARSAGRSWDEIGAALELPDYEFDSRAEVTFAWLVEGREPAPAHRDPVPVFHPPSSSWRCGTCAALVTDRGPYESHPDDNETGHASDCTRHIAAIAAWKTRTGWEDE